MWKALATYTGHGYMNVFVVLRIWLEPISIIFPFRFPSLPPINAFLFTRNLTFRSYKSWRTRQHAQPTARLKCSRSWHTRRRATFTSLKSARQCPQSAQSIGLWVCQQLACSSSTIFPLRAVRRTRSHAIAVAIPCIFASSMASSCAHGFGD